MNLVSRLCLINVFNTYTNYPKPFQDLLAVPTLETTLVLRGTVKRKDEKKLVKNGLGSSKVRLSKCKNLKKGQNDMKSVKLKLKQGLNDTKGFEGRVKSCNEMAEFWIEQLNKPLVVLRVGMTIFPRPSLLYPKRIFSAPQRQWGAFAGRGWGKILAPHHRVGRGWA